MRTWGAAVLRPYKRRIRISCRQNHAPTHSFDCLACLRCRDLPWSAQDSDSSKAGIWLDVPFIKQTVEGCGSASIAMLLQYWSAHGTKVTPERADADAIQKQLYSRKGTWHLRFGSRKVFARIWISRVCAARRVERSARSFVERPSADSEHRTGRFARSATLCCRDRNRLAARSCVCERSGARQTFANRESGIRERMAGDQELFVAGGAGLRSCGIVRFVVLAFCLVASNLLFSEFSFARQSSPASNPKQQDGDVKSPLQNAESIEDGGARLAAAQKAFDEKHYDEAARIAHGPANQSANLDFVAGLALAKLQRWQESRAAFLQGHRKEPQQARFLIELAGVDYKLKDARAAKRELRSALKIDPKDKYTLEFLGTLYFLDGNTEAALKYWNAIEKPRLRKGLGRASANARSSLAAKRDRIQCAASFNSRCVARRGSSAR